MVITAIIMGFAGSFHCVGMCSPLAMAVSQINPSVILNRLVYNLGRILTYGVLGSVVGTVGLALPLGKFQDILSVLLGIVLIFFAVIGINTVRIPGVTALLQKISSKLKTVFKRFLQEKSYSSIFILGSLNGLLPCGLTFVALTYCLTLGSPITSFYYMLLFGLGTLPAMLGLTAAFQYLVKRFNVSLRRVTTGILFISGCLLIARVLFSNEMHPAHKGQDNIDITTCGARL